MQTNNLSKAYEKFPEISEKWTNLDYQSHLTRLDNIFGGERLNPIDNSGDGQILWAISGCHVLPPEIINNAR